MQLKHKIALLAVLPLLLVVAAIGVIVVAQSQRLAAQQAAAIEESLLAAKRTELRHYVELALTSIHHVYASGRNDAAALEEAKAILRDMNYGSDGYFFVYDSQGRSLVHPRQPGIVGQNLWELRDPNGLPVIQSLIRAARAGGGFQRYQWQKPSTGQMTGKLGYVVMLDRWGWILGTGIYLDDVEQTMAAIRARTAANIRLTMGQFALVAMISALVVFAGGMTLNVSEHRLADGRLKALAQRIVTLQEDERARVSRELHDGISQLLASTKYQFELAQHQIEESAGDPARALGKGLDGLSEAISEVRRISHDLHPSLLDSLGLPAALEQLAREFAERTGIRVATNVMADANGLPEAAALTLFRIAQEALTNIERHAGAACVQLALLRDAAFMRLSVRDDGHGFDAARLELQRGIGLRNIRERVEHHGGQLRLDSGPGGTEITAALPLAGADKGAA